ncbi:hypothetical protein DRP77_05155 [Candidatus Poribacteria bacterium]|nr:MAG: hypothetical protein DRP77_05155 [Candidatus Poribacteria bacterium]
MHYREYCMLNGAKHLGISPTGDIGFYEELKIIAKKHSSFFSSVELMSPVKAPRWYPILKRLIDTTASILGLMFCSFPFLIISIAVKFDTSGPVFYRQDRVGKNGKVFKMLKFRTMVKDAELKTGPIWASDEDPRLTRVGRFLKRSKLDELPQLINVLIGDMSLVGPRPERPEFVLNFVEIIPAYDRRHDVKSGITGLAQLFSGYDKGAESIYRKLRWDVRYIKKMGLKMDMWLIFRTIWALFKGET